MSFAVDNKNRLDSIKLACYNKMILFLFGLTGEMHG